MQTLLIVVHLIIVVALIALILLQRSEGGALGIGGGGGFMTGRGQANVLTRATAILAALFFLTSLALTVHANWTRAPKSILEGTAPPAGPQVPATAPSTTVLDELKKIEQQRQGQPEEPQTPKSE